MLAVLPDASCALVLANSNGYCSLSCGIDMFPAASARAHPALHWTLDRAQLGWLTARGSHGKPTVMVASTAPARPPAVRDTNGGIFALAFCDFHELRCRQKSSQEERASGWDKLACLRRRGNLVLGRSRLCVPGRASERHGQWLVAEGTLEKLEMGRPATEMMSILHTCQSILVGAHYAIWGCRWWHR